MNRYIGEFFSSGVPFSKYTRLILGRAWKATSPGVISSIILYVPLASRNSSILSLELIQTCRRNVIKFVCIADTV